MTDGERGIQRVIIDVYIKDEREKRNRQINSHHSDCIPLVIANM